jgi:hypothetical protein
MWRFLKPKNTKSDTKGDEDGLSQKIQELCKIEKDKSKRPAKNQCYSGMY